MKNPIATSLGKLTANAIFLFVVGVGALALQTGCSEIADTGTQVTIPSIYINCQTTACRSTYTNPRISLSITGSGCGAGREFDERVGGTTTSITCTGSGCRGYFPGSWVDKNGASTSKMASGSFSVCACINSNTGTIPWTSCQTVGQEDGVSITSSTGTVTINGWTGQ